MKYFLSIFICFFISLSCIAKTTIYNVDNQWHVLKPGESYRFGQRFTPETKMQIWDFICYAKKSASNRSSIGTGLIFYSKVNRFYYLANYPGTSIDVPWNDATITLPLKYVPEDIDKFINSHSDVSFDSIDVAATNVGYMGNMKTGMTIDVKCSPLTRIVPLLRASKLQVWP